MKKDLYPWFLLTVTSLGVAANGLNMSVLNVALPAISAHFQSGAMATSWILISYMLFNSVLILVFGRLADIYGRRTLYLFGVTEYALTSLLCGFAPNVGILIFLRILQAFGAALLITNTTPLLTDAFPRHQLPQALGINALVLSISQLIGPVLGGFLVVNFGWPWVFWINVPMALLCSIWGFLKIRPTPKAVQHDRIDMLGNLTALFSLGGLIIALSACGESGFFSWPVLLGFVAFLAGLAFFIRYERRIDFPMIDLSLFENHSYAMANLAALLNACTRAAILLLVSLYAQFVELEDPQQAGLIVLPMAIGTAIASPIAGALARRWQAKYLSTSGLLVSIVGIIMIIAYFSRPGFIIWLILGQWLVGFGNGVFQIPNTTTIMLTVSAERRGVANGIRSMSQNIGKLSSTALSMMLITSFLPANLKNAIYRGQAQHLQSSEVSLLTNGFQVAMLVMLALTVTAMAVSWSRGQEKQSSV